MTYRGTVKRGVVVFAKAPPLKDGTPVRVEPISRRKKRTIARKRRKLHPVGNWDGEPGELERLLAEVQQARDADLDGLKIDNTWLALFHPFPRRTIKEK